MKKKCNLFLLLLFLLLGVEAAKANVESFDFTKMGFSDNQPINEIKGTNIDITFNTTSSYDIPYWNNLHSSVAVLGGSVNSFKIATKHSGHRIWRIVITFSDSGDCYIDEEDNDNYETNGVGKYKNKGNITTWTGPSDTVRFKNTYNNKTWLIQKIDVYYSIGGDGRNVTTPYTVSDVKTFSYMDWLPTEARYIKGVVSKVDDPSSGTISYHLSDNGIDTATIVVNDGKYLNGEQLTDKYQIARGDTVTVCGTVSKSEPDNTLIMQSPSLTSMKPCQDQITIKSAGWATYVSHRPIDFSNTEKVQAFKTKYDASSNSIVLSPVTAIPENTAVVLKGAEGSYMLTNTKNVGPLTDNELTFFTVDTPVTEDRTVYVLAYKQGVCGFFPFAKGKSLPSYKGYLPIKSTGAAKPFYKVDPKTPTGISSIGLQQSQAVRYNLAGERVDDSYKGIVIENGRKIIVK